jgi:hypothetical protein
MDPLCMDVNPCGQNRPPAGSRRADCITRRVVHISISGRSFKRLAKVYRGYVDLSWDNPAAALRKPLMSSSIPARANGAWMS